MPPIDNSSSRGNHQLNRDPLPKIVIVCGPTGVGKTAFAIGLAQRFHGQIVGADSMQIYRQMNVGTAKPTDAERAAVTHHMVDIIDPDQPFDAAVYGVQAHLVVQGLLQRGIVPFIVGGTGLYIKALIFGLFKSRAVDASLRQRLKYELETQGAAALHARLARNDPQAADRIHPNDAFRITRALEVIELTGQSISTHHRAHGFETPRYQTLIIGLALPREQLYARIDQRVEDMLKAGLPDEVRVLLNRGYDSNLKSMQSLGYRHMVEFIQGRLSWEEAVRTLKRDHRHYAKRQLTWFKAVPGIHWLAPDQEYIAAAQIVKFLSNGGSDTATEAQDS
ncbi:MAG: tRNA (adenosine(37)-N6)-dimethylallyltransferase MiaA [Desulfobacteraceae bacterium]|nr:tRNA (adenosine(37)-N6)-dimethylallyltransferase MiaA [Desulfobacteraceae bacterium]